MQPKLKKCSRCNKERPIWKNKTINGTKQQFCQTCWNITDRNTKKEKRKIQRDKKANSHKRLQDVLDKVFSLFIRLRDTNKEGKAFCCTCGELKEWNQLQCGHFQSRRFMSTRYEPKNSSAQCIACNILFSGEQYKHGLFLNNKWGEDTANQLYLLSQEIKKYETSELKELIDYYTQEVREMIKQKDFEIKSP